MDPDERVEVSLILPGQQPSVAPAAEPMSREEYAERFGAAPAAMARVEEFARGHGLEVVESSQARRTVRVAGRAADVAAAFGVSFVQVTGSDGQTYRAPDGQPTLPDGVEAVFGLDTRPVAHPRG